MKQFDQKPVAKNVESNLGSPSSASSVTGADAFSKINTLNSKINTFVKSKTFSVTTTASGDADINTTNLGYTRTQCLILAIVTDIGTGDTILPIVGVYRASPTSWTIKFQQGNSVVASKTFNVTVWYVLL